MPAEVIKEAVLYSAVASVFISLLSLACILYFRRSKSTYNEETRRMELDVMRRSFEEKIYNLTQRMQSNPQRWKEVNHLILDGNSNAPDESSPYTGVPRIDQSHFLDELGIDVGSLKMVPNQVFVLTPFHEMYESTYLAIKSACKLNGLVAVRGDEAFKAGNILKHIIEQILVSPYIIANINGRNPNVHYELGIAHSLGKNIVLVSETLDDVAFDLQGERILTYKNRDELNVKLYVYYTKLLTAKGRNVNQRASQDSTEAP